MASSYFNILKNGHCIVVRQKAHRTFLIFSCIVFMSIVLTVKLSRYKHRRNEADFFSGLSSKNSSQLGAGFVFPSIDHKRLSGRRYDVDYSLNNESNAYRSQQRLVPNLVHVIWFYPRDTEFRFHALICLLSAHKFLKPDQIIFWYSNIPTGPWWTFIKHLIPEMISLRLEQPTEIMGHPVKVPEHQSDVARLNILIKYGGIYIDLDVVVVKSFSPLLHHEVCMGAETPHLLGSGVITAAPNATFLRIWLSHYTTFQDDKWNDHSVVLPMVLAKKYPELIHIEWFSLERPNWDEREWLYRRGYLWDWSENLAVHLWYRTHNVDYNPDSIRKLNTTMGELFRYVYYGNPDIL